RPPADHPDRFLAHFDDEYDFVHVVFGRSYPTNRSGFATRNDVTGIGLPVFDQNPVYGSAGRLPGMVVFPIPTLFDGISPSTSTTRSRRWAAATTSWCRTAPPSRS